MKKVVSIFFISFLSLILISWGIVGHRTIADIAERHLTPSAKAAVVDLLNGESMSEASTWADEIRSEGLYRGSASWHFLNLPLGLTHDLFNEKVKNMSRENVYSALLKFEDILRDPNSSKEQKAEALKFVIHFVGDIHQPMHVSRAEDKGGNTIQLNYDGKGTNLHSLWDTRLLEHEGLSEAQLVEKCDREAAGKIQEWQSSSPLQWAWESYQISTRLYGEVEGLGSHKINDSYYTEHIGTIETRIAEGGTRLAGILNEIFKDYKSGRSVPHEAIKASAVNDGITSICDHVYTTKYFKNTGMTLLNLGAPYPNQSMTIVIRDQTSGQFPEQPDQYFRNKDICVTGRQKMYRGKPEIEVTDINQIKIKK